MSVRLNLLAILELGECYGHQLRSELMTRTGSGRGVNIGQVYNTLDRLERDGLVRRGRPDARGHVYWRITPEGIASIRHWFDTPVDPTAGDRDDVVSKLTLASTLPTVDAAAAIATQRDATATRLTRLRNEAQSDVTGWERAMVLDAEALSAEAELCWLDSARARVCGTPHAPRDLSRDLPRRGRPRRSVAG